MSAESIRQRLAAAKPELVPYPGHIALAMGDVPVEGAVMRKVDQAAVAALHDRAPADLELLLKLVDAADLRHCHLSREAVRYKYRVDDPDLSTGNWCGCGKRFCHELEALDALEAAP